MEPLISNVTYDSDLLLEITFVLAGAYGALLVLLRSWKGSTAVNYPPHPKPCYPVLGNALSLPRFQDGIHPDPTYLKWAKELGPIYSLKIPILGRLIIVSDPELIRHITVSKNYSKSCLYNGIAPVMGKRSIITLHGAAWKKYRKAFAPGFTTVYLKENLSVIYDKLERFIGSVNLDIAMDRPTKTLEIAQALTADVIVQVAFGEDWNEEDGGKAKKEQASFHEMSTICTTFIHDPFAATFDFEKKRRLQLLEKEFDDFMGVVLDRKIAQWKQQQEFKKVLPGANSEPKKPKTDCQNICLFAIDALMQPDGSLTEEDRLSAIDQLKTFYYAGHDSTATTISWAVWLLSQYPAVVEKLRMELNSHGVFPDRDIHKRATYEELHSCAYLDAVVKESMRMYPVASTARYCENKNETWKGYNIGGSHLVIPAYVLHRMPTLWEKPDEFLPERFMNVSPQSYSRKFMPFSHGPQDCLGRYMALLEVKIAVAALVQCYDMTCMNPKEDIGYRLIPYPKQGAMVKMEHRSSGNCAIKIP